MMENIILKELTLKELKEVAKNIEIPNYSSLRKDQLIQELNKCFKKYHKYKAKQNDKYKVISQLGESGKEGTTNLVASKKLQDRELAMKKFKKTKSIDCIHREADFQKRASKHGITPVIHEVDEFGRSIVMDKLDENLPDHIRKAGSLSPDLQKQIINIIKKLDDIGIFHADPNPFNFMIKNGKVFIIDFGFAKDIDDQLIKQHGTTPNKSFMILGLILKLKDLFDDIDCSYLKSTLDPKQQMVLEL